MGQLVAFPKPRVVDHPVSYRQLGWLLGRSRRWIEERVKEGMPSQMEDGRRIFYLSQVETWLDERDRRAS